MSVPHVISFYADPWGSRIYSNAAAKLGAKLDEFDLPHTIVNHTWAGGWRNTCLAKPRFMLSQLRWLRKPLLWLDADTDLRMAIPDDDWEQFDLAACERDVDYTLSRQIVPVQAHMLYLRPCEATFEFLHRWIEAAEGAEHGSDHLHLGRQWVAANKAGVRLRTLPKAMYGEDGRILAYGISDYPQKQEEHRRIVREFVAGTGVRNDPFLLTKAPPAAHVQYLDDELNKRLLERRVGRPIGWTSNRDDRGKLIMGSTMIESAHESDPVWCDGDPLWLLPRFFPELKPVPGGPQEFQCYIEAGTDPLDVVARIAGAERLITGDFACLVVADAYGVPVTWAGRQTGTLSAYLMDTGRDPQATGELSPASPNLDTIAGDFPAEAFAEDAPA